MSLYVSLGLGPRLRAVVPPPYPPRRTTVLKSPNTDLVTLPPMVDGSITAAVAALSKTLASYFFYSGRK